MPFLQQEIAILRHQPVDSPKLHRTEAELPTGLPPNCPATELPELPFVQIATGDAWLPKLPVRDGFKCG
jgi:hypothetical protein